MGTRSTQAGYRHSLAGAMAVAMTIVLAGCAVQATPSPAAVPSAPSPSASDSPSPTPPIICDDGPNAHTPMPADCVLPSGAGLPLPTPPPTAEPARPGATDALPPGLATLPPVTPWHGKTIYTPPAGSGAQLIGVGPDDTLYVLLARPLPTPKPAPSAIMFVPDVQASVIALAPDGSLRAGWPKAGVPISGFPTSYKVSEAGTVFVASGANPFNSKAGTASRLTITAISGGKILPGWPYRTPAARQTIDPDLIVPGPSGVVCFVDIAPGAPTAGYEVPYLLYCLGRDGKLLAGWPYSSKLPLMKPAVGPDGTVYVAQITSTPLTGSGSFPYRVLALGIDGKPKPGWTPWNRADGQGLTTILPANDVRVYVLIGGDWGRAQLVELGPGGAAVQDRPELPSTLSSPEYKDAVLTSGGELFVAVADGTDLINAYGPDGSQLAGWPQVIGGWGDLAVATDGSVWVAWPVYSTSGANDTAEVALFDRNGHLAAGYPMACDFLSSYHGDGLFVTSDGTAYATAATTAGSRIVAFGR
jgi:hypothetical protein